MPRANLLMRVLARVLAAYHACPSCALYVLCSLHTLRANLLTQGACSLSASLTAQLCHGLVTNLKIIQNNLYDHNATISPTCLIQTYCPELHFSSRIHDSTLKNHTSKSITRPNFLLQSFPKMSYLSYLKTSELKSKRQVR